MTSAYTNVNLFVWRPFHVGGVTNPPTVLCKVCSRTPCTAKWFCLLAVLLGNTFATSSNLKRAVIMVENTIATATWSTKDGVRLRWALQVIVACREMSGMEPRMSQDSDESCRQAIDLSQNCAGRSPLDNDGFKPSGGETKMLPLKVPDPFHSQSSPPEPASTCSSGQIMDDYKEGREGVCDGAASSSAPQKEQTSARSKGSDVDVSTSRPFFAPPMTACSVTCDSFLLAWTVITHLLLTAWPYTSLSIVAAAGVTLPLVEN